jgi:hypothetical protein
MLCFVRLNILMLSVEMLRVAFYAECQYSEHRHAECRCTDSPYAECRGALYSLV